MRVRIHWNVGDYEDSMIIEGDTVEEIREKAEAEVAKRGGKNPWSEELK